MRNTIRNVTIVVPVLMTSCHVSEKPKYGPVTSQTTTASAARPKAADSPVRRATAAESCSRRDPRGCFHFVMGSPRVYGAHARALAFPTREAELTPAASAGERPRSRLRAWHDGCLDRDRRSALDCQ